MEVQPSFVVRNGFIDAVFDDDDDEDLARSMSDPTGGRQKRMMPLMKPDVKVPPIQEADERAEAGPAGLAEDDDDDDTPFERAQTAWSFGAPAVLSSEPARIDGEVDSDDDDDAPLQRAVTAYEHAASKVAKPPGQTLALSSLVPENEEDDDDDDASPPPDRTVTDWAYGLPMPMAGAAGYAHPKGGDVGNAGANPYMAGMPGMPFMMPGMPYMMPGMYDPSWMYQMPAAKGVGKGNDAKGQAQAQVPALGAGPPLGYTHSFHQETRNMGNISPDFRQFTKIGYEGRLSVVTESQVHTDGVQRYLVQFAGGDLSRADGVGFVFSPRLPCAKNIQRIVSIFVNQSGHICTRLFADIVREKTHIKQLQVGDWIEMAMDLEKKVATFNIWPSTATGWPAFTGRPSSTVDFPYGTKFAKMNQAGNAKPVNLSTGHLACVVKNEGVTIMLGS